MKLDKMIRYIPGIYKGDTNPNVRGMLYAWSEEDDLLVEAIQAAKEEIFVKSANLQYLDALGSNVGVFRPTEFNLVDEAFRKLIPALSFYPKQVVPTIKKVLEAFYGDNNSRVDVYELNPNEIVVEIPSSVPALRRDLRGSHHFHAYNGTIDSINNSTKEMIIDLTDTTKQLAVDELAFATFGQGLETGILLSNSSGNSGVTFQFPASVDLTKFTASETFNMVVDNYQGAFFSDPTSSFSITQGRGVLGQAVSSGSIVPTMIMQDASNIPDASGKLVFNLGKDNQEELVDYFGRPNNTTLLVSPTHIFQKDHEIGEPINVIVSPNQAPSIYGHDYSIYLVGVTAARILAQNIVESIVASGVVIRWIVNDPICV